jgi:hypothetical protein
MTTVDIHIQRLGEQDSLSLHNGLFGPATTVYHAAHDASRSGRAVGGWNDHGGLDVTVTGRELRTMLAQVSQLPPHHQRPDDDERLQRFYESIVDDATYRIRGTEF